MRLPTFYELFLIPNWGSKYIYTSREGGFWRKQSRLQKSVCFACMYAEGYWLSWRGMISYKQEKTWKNVPVRWMGWQTASGWQTESASPYFVIVLSNKFLWCTWVLGHLLSWLGRTIRFLLHQNAPFHAARCGSIRSALWLSTQRAAIACAAWWSLSGSKLILFLQTFTFIPNRSLGFLCVVRQREIL